ncbi:MAG: nucleotidyltransferase family protein [Azoarcus sp.]|jgi:MurNAc alpha-1-phosphate uridylyltransferase|nr:nucleotidyltransferase family protein [Azoarcus sp.]
MKAMILAAGRGERMRPLTDHCPKPLLAVGGKPLIVRHIKRLAAAGITELVINHAHLGHMLEAALGDGSALGVNIRWSPEPPGALETAGGIRQAMQFLGENPFIVVNSDIFCEADFATLARIAKRLSPDGDIAHLLLIDNPEHNPSGDFALDGARVHAEGDSRLTFSGIAAYHPALFAPLEAGKPARLAPVLRAAMGTNRISGEHYQGRWVDVGTPERLAQLDDSLRSEMRSGTKNERHSIHGSPNRD